MWLPLRARLGHPPGSFSRTASSTPISSKGLMDILGLARSTPEPSALTRTLGVGIDNSFDGYHDFHNQALTR